MVNVHVSLKLEATWDFFSRRIERRPKQIVFIERKKTKTTKKKGHKSLFESLLKNTWKDMELKYLDQKEDKCCLFIIAKSFADWVTRR